MLKLIIFDFDGTIVDSSDIKLNAFKLLFSSINYRHYFTEICSYLEKNHGRPRAEKFEFIYKNILKMSLSEQKKAELSSEFSETVLREVLKCRFVKGAEQFLGKHANSVKMFVVSATPESELKFILEKRGILKLFAGVFGAPQKKSDLIAYLLQSEKVKPSEAVLIGDSMSDFEAAKTNNLSFIGMLSGENFPKGIKVVRDFIELEHELGAKL